MGGGLQNHPKGRGPLVNLTQLLSVSLLPREEELTGQSALHFPSSDLLTPYRPCPPEHMPLDDVKDVKAVFLCCVFLA